MKRYGTRVNSKDLYIYICIYFVEKLILSPFISKEIFLYGKNNFKFIVLNFIIVIMEFD